MTVSVVILNWNGIQHLETLFTALAAQDVFPFQTILVDNGSADDSVDFTKDRFPWVEVVQLAENRGFSGGNLAGLRAATGDAIVLLNNDTMPARDCIRRLKECAEARSEVGIVAAHLVNWTGDRTDSAGDGCKVTGRGYARHRRQPSERAPSSGYVLCACAGAALYKRECIDDVGFLDEDFFLNYEDTDLSLRAQWRGWKVWFCREAVVRHRVSASQGRLSKTNVYYCARNHLLVCAKDFPLMLLFKYAVFIIAEIAAMYVVAVRAGKGTTYLSGLTNGLSNLPAALRKRRHILSRRSIGIRQFDRALTPVPLSFATLRPIFQR